MARKVNWVLDAAMLLVGVVLLAILLMACGGCSPGNRAGVDADGNPVASADGYEPESPLAGAQADAAPVTAAQLAAWTAQAAGEVEAAWWVKLLHSDAVEWLFNNLVLIVFVIGGGWLFKKFTKTQAQKDAVDIAMKSLAAGVNNTFHTYTQEARKAAEDGKLTVAEQQEARRRAMDYAKSAAAEKGVDLLKTLGARFIPSLIDEAVKEAKKKSDPAPSDG